MKIAVEEVIGDGHVGNGGDRTDSMISVGHCSSPPNLSLSSVYLSTLPTNPSFYTTFYYYCSFLLTPDGSRGFPPLLPNRSPGAILLHIGSNLRLGKPSEENQITVVHIQVPRET
jgi:hypothetical protein